MNVLGDLPLPFPDRQAADSTFTLSYLGDAWYELWCRQTVLSQMQKPELVHEHVTQMVRCQAQAEVAEMLEPLLTAEERKIYRRGKNRKVLSCPKNATVKEYRISTGFECLVGYWYLTQNTARFQTLMHHETVWTWIQQKLQTV